ncbi:MAG TPA: DUF4411 family protein [Rhodospirillales bacterium]|nr:DUF4411 family protein [Rhodospirillales bacterium]
MWHNFDDLIKDGQIVSTREVRREIDNCPVERLRDWAADNGEVFPTPTEEEGAFVAQIYAVPHFQQNIERQKLLKGGVLADPFVIAKASVIEGTVVTMEGLKPNAAKIPNICQYFGVGYMNLEKFMEAEQWQF